MLPWLRVAVLPVPPARDRECGQREELSFFTAAPPAPGQASWHGAGPTPRASLALTASSWIAPLDPLQAASRSGRTQAHGNGIHCPCPQCESVQCAIRVALLCKRKFFLPRAQAAVELAGLDDACCGRERACRQAAGTALADEHGSAACRNFTEPAGEIVDRDIAGAGQMARGELMRFPHVDEDQVPLAVQCCTQFPRREPAQAGRVVEIAGRRDRRADRHTPHSRHGA